MGSVASGIITFCVAHADDSPDIVGVRCIVGKVVDERHYSEKSGHENDQYFAPPDDAGGGEVVHVDILRVHN